MPGVWEKQVRFPPAAGAGEMVPLGGGVGVGFPHPLGGWLSRQDHIFQCSTSSEMDSRVPSIAQVPVSKAVVAQQNGKVGRAGERNVLSPYPMPGKSYWMLLQILIKR